MTTPRPRDREIFLCHEGIVIGKSNSLSPSLSLSLSVRIRPHQSFVVRSREVRKTDQASHATQTEKNERTTVFLFFLFPVGSFSGKSGSYSRARAFCAFPNICSPSNFDRNVFVPREFTQSLSVARAWRGKKINSYICCTSGLARIFV